MGKLKTEFGHKSRMIIHKIPPLYRLCLKIVRDGGKLSYAKLDKKENYSRRLQDLKDTKIGKRCFIVGNGPSLTTTDLEKLKYEDCFAANKIYKIFEKTEWRPKYYVVADWSGLNDEDADKVNVETVFFGDHFYRLHNIKMDNAIVFYGDRLLDTKPESFHFSNDISKGICLGATVTYACMQIAVYMGYKEIYLLGIDHNFAYVVDSKGNIVKNPNVEESHFFSEDASKAYADMIGMSNAYIDAKKYAEMHGIKIYNATRGGALEIYPRVNFDDLF